jgi:hypothetical protein
MPLRRADTGRGIALVIPGLCGPSLDESPATWLTRRPAALERLLSRARTAAAPEDADVTVCSFFDLAGTSGSPPPLAPLTWLADTGRPPSGYMLRADPVHVRADQACLRLYDSTTFDIDAAEAAALVESFNGFYRERGWRLAAPVPQRWYLHLPGVPDISTVAPANISGGNVDGSLPAGRDAAAWHALLNEVQMLFHDHPVNAAREARGALVINSLWPWGGGILPERVVSRVAQVWTDQPLGAGLARLAGIPWQAVPAGAAGIADALLHGVNLVVLDALQTSARHAEVETWAQGLAQLEQDWFVPLSTWLEGGMLTTLEIYPVTGRRYRLNRSGLRHFWKRIRPLSRSCRRG